MESFETILMAGGHMNSLGRSREVYDIVKASPQRLDELFACILADDAWVRMRAIDTFEKLIRDNPAMAKPYTKVLVEELTHEEQPSIQWHLAQLFTVIELSDDYVVRVLSWLKKLISTTDVDWIVSANAMKALHYFYEQGKVTNAELRKLLEVQTKHASKTVRKKANLILDSL